MPTRGLATNREENRGRGLLRVGMSGDYAPFCLCPKLPESNTACTGFEVEVAHCLASDLGVQRFNYINNSEE
jgi:hypothetical protein